MIAKFAALCYFCLHTCSISHANNNQEQQSISFETDHLIFTNSRGVYSNYILITNYTLHSNLWFC